MRTQFYQCHARTTINDEPCIKQFFFLLPKSKSGYPQTDMTHTIHIKHIVTNILIKIALKI